MWAVAPHMLSEKAQAMLQNLNLCAKPCQESVAVSTWLYVHTGVFRTFKKMVGTHTGAKTHTMTAHF